MARRKKKRKVSKGKKILLVVISLMITLSLLGVLFMFDAYNTIFKDNVSSEKEPVKGVTNVLLIGTDDRVMGEGGVRADTIMILTVNSVSKKIKLTSIMRDTLVSIPGYGDQKINHSFAYGQEQLLMDTIEQNFNIPISKYVRINFEGFKEVINYLDGIEVEITNEEELNELNRVILLEMYENPDMIDSEIRRICDKDLLLIPRDEGAEYLIKENPNITSEEYQYLVKNAGLVENLGAVKLDGHQALAYARMRHSTNGSYGRVERQRNVVSQMINKFMDMPIYKYPFAAKKLLPYIKTNMPIGDTAKLGWSVIRIKNLNIEQMQVPPSDLSDGRILGNKGYVFTWDTEATNQRMHDFIYEGVTFEYTKPSQDVESENYNTNSDRGNDTSSETTNNKENSTTNNSGSESVEENNKEENTPPPTESPEENNPSEQPGGNNSSEQPGENNSGEDNSGENSGESSGETVPEEKPEENNPGSGNESGENQGSGNGESIEGNGTDENGGESTSNNNGQ